MPIKKGESEMNGDLGKIYKAVNEVKTDVEVLAKQQTLNHTENKGDIEVLFDKIGKVDLLPCAVHVEKFRTYDKSLAIGSTWKVALVIVFLGLIIEAVAFAVSWGRIVESNEGIHRQIKLLHPAPALEFSNGNN